MKKRKGFVSNSSSSSFIIPLGRLTLEQRAKIEDHRTLAGGDAWSIWEEDDNLHGSTCMDNFSMHSYLDKIGVDIHADYIKWDW